MKKFFMVNKDVKFVNGQHEWIKVSKDEVFEAAKIDDDVKSVKVFTSLEDAKVAALDDVDFNVETDFFPIFAINVADEVKGRKAKYSLKDGSTLDAISIKPEQIMEVTDVFLDHIDYVTNDDAAAAIKPSRLAAMSQYLPSAKAVLKNALMIGGTGAAYYFGNEAVVDLAANASIVVPEMLAASAALPLVVGTTARLLTELPELSVKVASFIAKAAGKLIGAGVPTTPNVKTSPMIDELKEKFTEETRKSAPAIDDPLQASPAITVVRDTWAQQAKQAQVSQPVVNNKKPDNKMFLH